METDHSSLSRNQVLLHDRVSRHISPLGYQISLKASYEGLTAKFFSKVWMNYNHLEGFNQFLLQVSLCFVSVTANLIRWNKENGLLPIVKKKIQI